MNLLDEPPKRASLRLPFAFRVSSISFVLLSLKSFFVKFYIGVSLINWRRKWQPTPVSLPGESHGQKNFVGYNQCPWGCKELDMTEQLIVLLL